MGAGFSATGSETECNPKDVAAYIKKKMEEQSKRDTEEDDDNESGTKYIFLDSLTVSAVRY